MKWLSLLSDSGESSPLRHFSLAVGRNGVSVWHLLGKLEHCSALPLSGSQFGSRNIFPPGAEWRDHVLSRVWRLSSCLKYDWNSCLMVFFLQSPLPCNSTTGHIIIIFFYYMGEYLCTYIKTSVTCFISHLGCCKNPNLSSSASLNISTTTLEKKTASRMTINTSLKQKAFMRL